MTQIASPAPPIRRQTAITWDQSCKFPHSLEIIKFIIPPKTLHPSACSFVVSVAPPAESSMSDFSSLSSRNEFLVPSFLPVSLTCVYKSNETHHRDPSSMQMHACHVQALTPASHPVVWAGMLTCLCADGSAFTSRTSIRVTRKSLRHHFCLLKSFHEFDRCRRTFSMWL